ncbi:hypothetical protein [Novosphingobium sp.]|uniref:hypothetical protein n=1 Tax=Novosphingobium sp. TaxID=1874826 RepID=UPI002FDED86D
MTMLSQLAPVVVGGFIAVAGGLVGPPLAHYLKVRREDSQAKKLRLEKLVLNIFAHHEWVDQSCRNGVNDMDLPDPIPDTPQMYATIRVYFPELREAAARVSENTAVMLVWALRIRQSEKLDEQGALNAQHDEKYRLYSSAVASLLNACEDLARKSERRKTILD